MSTARHASNKYQRTRKDLLKRGTNVRRWARAHGYHEQSVYHAIKGNRNGVLSYEIRNKMESYLNE